MVWIDYQVKTMNYLLIMIMIRNKIGVRKDLLHLFFYKKINSMKNKNLFLILFFIIAISACQTEKNKPTGLMTEFIRQPENVKIIDNKPEFSWTVTEKAVEQSAFQIMMSSSLKKIRRNKADIWDSGKIPVKNSTEIEYDGPELNENTDYYWKVRVWNILDKPTAYSSIQHFKTGSFTDYATTSNNFQITLNKAVKSVTISEDHHFYDFGKAGFGSLILKIKPKQTDTLIIHLGEKLIAENRIDRNPQGSIRYQRTELIVSPKETKYQVLLPPDKRNTGSRAVQLPDSFGVVIPFRYCEIENFNADPDNNVFQKLYSYTFDDEASYFTSSDTILNQIWDICKYSIKATSFTGLYVDGDRERIPYEGDAYINQLGHYCTDREYSMARLTNEYFLSNPTWPTEWILHTVPMFYKDYLYTGNLESIENNYDHLKNKTLHFLAREDGLITVKSEKLTAEYMQKLGFSDPNASLRDLVDWPPGQKDTGWKLARPEGERDGYDMVDVNTVVNAFYFWNLELMEEIAGFLDKKEDSVLFHDLAKKVRNTFNNILIDQEKGIYIDGEGSSHSSLHANMLPLAVGLVPDEYQDSVIAFIKSRGMACSVYGAQYLMEGLYKKGEAEYAKGLLTATHDRSWWNMIKSGSTITMEAWDMKYKPNSDWNHAWGAVPANIIPRYLWGIRPTKPGFSEAIIQPQITDLSFSEIKFPTIRGPIEAKFKLTKDHNKEYKIRIPGNMAANFVLPINEAGNYDVFVNGNQLFTKENNITLKAGWNKIELKTN